MNNVKLGFLILSFLLVIALFAMIIYAVRMNNQYKKRLVLPIGIGIIAIIVYAVFLLSSDYMMALFFNGLYFVCTDWLVLTVLAFSFDYTGFVYQHHKRGINVLTRTLLCCVLLDSVSLLVNTFTHHSFNLAWVLHKPGVFYWSLSMTPVHYVHLGFCYVVVLMSLALLIHSARRMPHLYRMKYMGILFAYIIVIIINFVCYSMDLIIDVSVLFYGIMAGFICYYSAYGFPIQVLSNSLREVMKSIPEGTVYFDVDGVCIFKNKHIDEMFAQDAKLYAYPSVESYRDEHILNRLSGKETDEWPEEFKVNGKQRHYIVEYQKVYHKKAYVGYFLRFRDNTKEVNSFLREKYLATHDALTGIYNREGFFEAAEKKLEEDPETERLMLYSNIKDFKLINELFGTTVGDAVLKKQADIMRRYCNDDTIYGRMNDDKFAMLINVIDFEQDDFFEGIEELKQLAESSVYQMHIYIGVYDPQGKHENAHIMCDKAKMAIDAIAGDYRQVFVFYDDQLMEKLLLEKDVVNRFERSLYQGQFHMYLQAQVDATGRMLGAEALVRWLHPVHGLIPPGTFIEILERTGYIHRLDAFIWEQAAKCLCNWKAKGREDIHISVNVSPRDFYYIDVYEAFTRLVQKYDINPAKLKIEITETVLLTDFNKAMELFEKLQAFGFEIEIDDFGSGYSSLNMLKDIRADILKIDMAFLKQTENEDRSRIVLSSIIDMAKLLNMKVITEGVETKERVEMLYSLGCKLFQGYYFSKPLSINEFEEKYHIV